MNPTTSQGKDQKDKASSLQLTKVNFLQKSQKNPSYKKFPMQNSRQNSVLIPLDAGCQVANDDECPEDVDENLTNRSCSGGDHMDKNIKDGRSILQVDKKRRQQQCVPPDFGHVTKNSCHLVQDKGKIRGDWYNPSEFIPSLEKFNSDQNLGVDKQKRPQQSNKFESAKSPVRGNPNQSQNISLGASFVDFFKKTIEKVQFQYNQHSGQGRQHNENHCKPQNQEEEVKQNVVTTPLLQDNFTSLKGPPCEDNSHQSVCQINIQQLQIINLQMGSNHQGTNKHNDQMYPQHQDKQNNQRDHQNIQNNPLQQNSINEGASLKSPIKASGQQNQDEAILSFKIIRMISEISHHALRANSQNSQGCPGNKNQLRKSTIQANITFTVNNGQILHSSIKVENDIIQEGEAFQFLVMLLTMASQLSISGVTVSYRRLVFHALRNLSGYMPMQFSIIRKLVLFLMKSQLPMQVLKNMQQGFTSQSFKVFNTRDELFLRYLTVRALNSQSFVPNCAHIIICMPCDLKKTKQLLNLARFSRAQNQKRRKKESSMHNSVYFAQQPSSIISNEKSHSIPSLIKGVSVKPQISNGRKSSKKLVNFEDVTSRSSLKSPSIRQKHIVNGILIPSLQEKTDNSQKPLPNTPLELKANPNFQSYHFAREELKSSQSDNDSLSPPQSKSYQPRMNKSGNDNLGSPQSSRKRSVLQTGKKSINISKRRHQNQEETKSPTPKICIINPAENGNNNEIKLITGVDKQQESSRKDENFSNVVQEKIMSNRSNENNVLSPFRQPSEGSNTSDHKNIQESLTAQHPLLVEQDSNYLQIKPRGGLNTPVVTSLFNKNSVVGKSKFGVVNPNQCKRVGSYRDGSGEMDRNPFEDQELADSFYDSQAGSQLGKSVSILKMARPQQSHYLHLFFSDKLLCENYYTEIADSLCLPNFIKRQEPQLNLIKKCEKKKTIVFDLDETLVKATNDPSKLPNGVYDEKCFMDLEDFTKKDIYLSFRPHLFEALQALKKNFELILFTAGQEIYADSIVQVLQQKERFFDYVISRENCSLHPNGKIQVKDLIQLLEGRDIKDIIIVDNRATSFAIHFTNGILIKDYEGDKSDKWLKSLVPYLQSFQNVSDVRSKIKCDFKLDKYVNQRGQIRSRIGSNSFALKSNISCRR